MSRPLRFDQPGTTLHIFNRGGNRRPTFPKRRDVRSFLAGLGCGVRRGEILVHAYTFVTNHYHLLVTSLTGDVSRVFQRVGSAFARTFNWRYGCEGHLFGRRFGSRVVRTNRYLVTAVRYLDHHAARTGLAPSAAQYPHGSAMYFLSGTEPPWLDTAWLDDLIATHCRPGTTRAAGYAQLFGGAVSDAQARFMELRMRSTSLGPDDLDDLLARGPDYVQRWFRERAHISGQARGFPPLVDAETVLEVVATFEAEDPAWRTNPTGRRRRSAWPMARVALLRELTRLSFARIGILTGCSVTRAQDLQRAHRGALACDPSYARRVSRLAKAALVACHA